MSQLRNFSKLFGVFKVSNGKIFEIDVDGIFRNGLIVEESVPGPDSLTGQFELHEFLTFLILIF
jgi:hypothetical protein